MSIVRIPNRRSRDGKPRCCSRQLLVEPLESRRLLAAILMSDWEQLLLELVNRARADPQAEAARFGIDLNRDLPAGTISPAAKPPLAPHPALVQAAGVHSQDMLNRNFFAHVNPDGLSPFDRMDVAGYDWITAGENISWNGTTGTLDRDAAILTHHKGLFESASHRVNLLHRDFREIGVGVRHGTFQHDGLSYNASMATEKFGTRSGAAMITGVVFSDTRVSDGFYSLGEGVGDVTITALNLATQASISTQSGPSGGYSLQAPAGTYRVTAQGGPLAGPIVVSNIVVGAENRKVDFEISADNSPPLASVAVDNITTAGAATHTITVTYTDNVAVDVSSLSSNNLRVTGPQGYDQLATWVQVDHPSNGTPRVATYQIQAPGGQWLAAHNGEYSVRLEANQVHDTSGNFMAAGEIGSFSVQIAPPADTTPPQASALAADILSRSGASHPVIVTYTDNVAIDVSTLGDSDIRVTGPNGFGQAARLTSVDVDTNGTPRIATYLIDAPPGGWTWAANGVYTLEVLADQVQDTSGNSLPASVIGEFRVDIPLPLLPELDSGRVLENQPAGTPVGNFLTDPLAGPVTFSLVPGPGDADNAWFSIFDGQLLTAAPLDFETQPNLQVRVRVTDQDGLSREASLDIEVRNLNEPPAAILLDDHSIHERLLGAVVGRLTVSDPDGGDSHQFTLSDNRFDVVNNQLRLREFERLIRDVEPTVSIEVTATDMGGLSISQQYTLTVLENPAPWQNPDHPLDVNNNGGVVPLDALVVINYLNTEGAGPLPPPGPAGPPYYLDTNGDNSVTPIDVLVIVNYLNRQNEGVLAVAAEREAGPAGTDSRQTAVEILGSSPDAAADSPASAPPVAAEAADCGQLSQASNLSDSLDAEIANREEPGEDLLALLAADVWGGWFARWS